MCRYFMSCVVFFQAPQGEKKMQKMSKMSSHIICWTKGFIIQLKFTIILLIASVSSNQDTKV